MWVIDSCFAHLQYTTRYLVDNKSLLLLLLYYKYLVKKCLAYSCLVKSHLTLVMLKYSTRVWLFSQCHNKESVKRSQLKRNHLLWRNKKNICKVNPTPGSFDRKGIYPRSRIENVLDWVVFEFSNVVRVIFLRQIERVLLKFFNWIKSKRT